MKYVEVKKDIYWVGSLDPDLRIFDIIMYTPYGTTYNSYVVKGSEKTALFETVKAKTFDQYLDRLNDLDINIDSIDYIIVDHTEPDHAGSIEKILELAPNAKVVGSKCAINFLQDIINKPFNFIEVSEGDTISLGNKTLRFINAPFLHWPDSIYTYIEEDNMLMTCDSFGSHYCCDKVFNDEIESRENYLEALEYYFNMIMGPFKSHVLKAINKIEKLNIDIICPGHGPVLRNNPQEIIDLYKKWSTELPEDAVTDDVTICYVSAYGYTEETANKIAEAIKANSNLNVNMFDVIHHDMNDILKSIAKSKGILFGTPTINGDALKPIWDILINLNPIVHGGKVAGAFGSFGWSGEGVPYVNERLKQLKMKVVEPFKFKFKPSYEELEESFKFGVNFTEKLTGTILELPSQGETKKWKCIICNEVFEGVNPPEICPACGAGKEQFVEVSEEVITFKSTSNEHIVIVGNGIAGLSAAEAIRKRNKICKVSLISNENTITYYRPSLSDGLGDELNYDNLFVKPFSWYKDNDMDLILNTSVESIDTLQKKLSLSSSNTIEYDKLILANGSHNFIPPVKGHDTKGVFTLRSLDDLNSITSQYDNTKDVVVIGGGILGVEAAVYLKKNNFNVTIVELADKLMCKQLDKQTSNILETAISDNGINIITKDSLSSIKGSDKVESIMLSSGKEISADMVIFSVGIRSNLSITNGTTIDTNRGIVVNENMETNIKDIYACGDVAELNGIVYGNWPTSLEMGRVAGINAVGDSDTFPKYINSLVFSELGLEIFSCGEICDCGCCELVHSDLEKGIHKKFSFKDNIITGGILVNDLSKSLDLVNAIKDNKSINDILVDKFI